jgi:hypothetical protein
VLKRDGTNVVVNSACTATSGTWVSPYDGATWTAASDLDIDHLVPLSNAWKVSYFFTDLRLWCERTGKEEDGMGHWINQSTDEMNQSGASAWTTAQRQAFANDVTNPQLLAVTDNVNESKGDSGPEDWKPSLSESHSLSFLLL